MSNLNINRVSRLPELQRKRAGLQRQLRQVENDIAWIERKEALIAFAAADVAASGRTDIPTLPVILAWDDKFRQDYHAQHQARNDAILASTQQLEVAPPGPGPEGALRERAQDPHEILAEADAQEALVNEVDFEALAQVRISGFDAAMPLVGSMEPRVSTLTCSQEGEGNVLAWWAGVYQRLGML